MLFRAAEEAALLGEFSHPALLKRKEIIHLKSRKLENPVSGTVCLLLLLLLFLLCSLKDQLAQPITNGTCALGVNGAGLFKSVLDKFRSLVLDDLTQRLIINSAADVRNVKWFVTVADIEVRNNMESMVLPVSQSVVFKLQPVPSGET